MWPYELSNGKWLLYPASLNLDGSADARCTSSGALNPLTLHSSSAAGITPVSHQVGLQSVTLKLKVRPRQWLSKAVTHRCVSLNVLLQQAGRARRSHPEDVGHVNTKGSMGRTTPAVAASDRRKSLKLVRRCDRKRRGKCICLGAHWSSSPPGLSSRVGPLHPDSVSSPQLLWTGCPEDPCQAVEQQLHRGGKHVFIFLSELERSSMSDNRTSVSEQTVNRSFRRYERQFQRRSSVSVRSFQLSALWSCWSEPTSPSSPASSTWS